MAIKPSERMHRIDVESDLNLAPIMNVVMILIPLLLISASFVVVGTLEVHSPRNAQAVTPPEEMDEEEIPVPRVLVAITEEGFTISDLRQSPAFLSSGLGTPIPECRSAGPAAGPVPVTICTRAGMTPDVPLLERLNWRQLYNRLVAIKNFNGDGVVPGWASQWDNSNSIINIVADNEIPVEVVIRTMDVARYFLEESSYNEEESFRTAVYEMRDEVPVGLFKSPVLLLPIPTGD